MKFNSTILRTVMVSILSLAFILPSFAQNTITVSGKIVDASNAPLAGVAVIQQGTSNGVMTGADGNYSINVPAAAILEISSLGYTTKNVPVNGRTVINEILEDDTVMLGEVIAIGYGSSRKEDLSMAVTSMKVDDLTKSRAGDLATVLQGRMPGVTIMQTGDPAQSASFTIRGRGSKGNDGDVNSGDGVLFVVDGVPGAPYQVDDIETITVLKDAASAAIYGASVGSSGVVLITTKHAQAGKTNVDVNISYGLEQVSHLPELLTAKQYQEVWAKAAANASAAVPSAADPTLYPWGSETRTDWLDEIYRTGTKQHYSVTVSGGTEKLKSIFSASYDNKQGVLLNTWSKKFQGSLYSEYQIARWLKVSERVSVDIANAQGNVSTSHQGPIMAAIWYPRAATVYELDKNTGEVLLDAEGNKIYGGTRPTWAGVTGTPLIQNPVAYLNRMHRLYPKSTIFSTTGIEIKPLSCLTFNSNFTVDMEDSQADEFYPVMMEIGLQRAKNFREQSFNHNYHWLSENTLTFAQVFGKHHVSALAGFTADFRKTNLKQIYTRDYQSEKENQLLWSLANDYWSTKPQEYSYEYAMLSLIGRVGYSYDDRYFLTASVRRDASSKLYKANNWDVFPAFSGSWKVTSEHFLEDTFVTSVFDLIKVRAGWGKVGNVDLFPNTVTEAQLLSYRWPIIFGKNLDQNLSGTYLNTIPNTAARWETTEQTSAGIDLTVFKGALNFSFDWYNKETKDLIDVVPTPQQLGVPESPMGNMGHVINRGIELSADYTGRAFNNQLTWNVWGNYSYNHGWVAEYGIRDTPVAHNTPNLNSMTLLYSDAGQPWYSYRVYRTDGIFRSQGEIDAYTWTNPETGVSQKIQPAAQVGDLKFKDLNNDGVINNDDRDWAGSYTPTSTFSFGGSLNFKGFDLSIMFQGVAGNYIYNGLKQLAMNGRDDYGNLVTDVLKTWDFDNANSKYPRLGLYNDLNGNYTTFSDMFLEKGDYLRFKNVTLGYTIPKIKNLDARFRVYVSADNILTFTRYSGVDPEPGNYGIDRGVYPLSRFINFGVNMNF